MNITRLAADDAPDYDLTSLRVGECIVEEIGIDSDEIEEWVTANSSLISEGTPHSSNWLRSEYGGDGDVTLIRVSRRNRIIGYSCSWPAAMLMAANNQ